MRKTLYQPKIRVKICVGDNGQIINGCLRNGKRLMQRTTHIVGAILFVLTAVIVTPVNIQFSSNTIMSSASGDVTTAINPKSTVTGYASHNLTLSELREIKAAGGSFVRADFSMSSVQPTSSQSFNWDQLDTKVAAALAEGLQVLGILDYSPQWNAHPGCVIGPRRECAPADPDAFANFAAAAATHFPQVTYWEIWNEPNLIRFWSPSPNSTDYVIMLNAAYAAIKAVAPHDVVVAGALSRASDIPGHQIAPTTFVTSMYANRAQFDILSLHPYTYPFSPDTPNSGNGWPDVAMIRATMVANGDFGKEDLDNRARSAHLRSRKCECGRYTAFHQERLHDRSSAADHYLGRDTGHKSGFLY